MSCAIHRYDASQRRLIDSQRNKERRADVFSRSKPLAASCVSTTRPATATSAVRRCQVPAAELERASHPQRRPNSAVDFDKQNREHLLEVQRQVRLQREEEKLTEISQRFAELELRQRAIAALETEERRNDAATKVVAAKAEAPCHSSSHQRPAEMPLYLANRISEQQRLKEAKLIAQAAEASERNFPAGRQPMDPDVAERTRQFLVERQADLELQLQNFSFVAEQSVSGQRRKTALEMQLREVEEALSKFQFPVVFVKSSKPQLSVKSSRAK